MIVVLSVVGVLGAAGAAMAVNSEILATAVDRPIGQAAVVLAASPTTAPVTATEPEVSEGPDELLPTPSLPPDPTSAPTPAATPAPDDAADDAADHGSEGPDDHGGDDSPEDDD